MDFFDSDTIKRFWSKVDIKGRDDCWEWHGKRRKKGYGLFYNNKKYIRAHRIALLLDGRNIPKGQFCCHTCDNPPCCNPTHLWAGTARQNADDCEQKGRRSIPRKLTDEDVRHIRAQARTRYVNMTLAVQYHVSPRTIKNIRSGQSRRLP